MTRSTRFVIAGFGNVGRQVAEFVRDNTSGALEIAGIAARDGDKARAAAREMGLDVPVVSAAEAPSLADVVVEAGTYDSFRDIVAPTIEAG